ncbi:MAG: DUF4965 domain-containing protein [Bryobacteraceae bacterium]
MRQVFLLLLAALCGFAADRPFRPPAVPLVTHDPYFSIWSMADRLTDEPTKHWTGTTQSLDSLVRVDGKSWRIMGVDPPRTQAVPAMPQTSLEVFPARTIYQFANSAVSVMLQFVTPALPDDLDVLSRPATYIVWSVKSLDGRDHDVSLYFDASAELTVNTMDQMVEWSRFKIGTATALRMGSRDQPVLQKSGDNLRIDWGRLYVTAPPDAGAAQAACDRRVARDEFLKTGRVPDSDDLNEDRPGRSRMPVLAWSFDLGRVGPAAVERHLVIAYDDGFSIEYLHRRLRPYWRRDVAGANAGAAALLRAALDDYQTLSARCARFDEQLMAGLERAGGRHYAQLCALAYRQTLAAHKLTADVDGRPLLFSKENFSNGSIDTVDVTYPSSPFFLLFSPKLLEAQIRPVFDYAELPRWKFPFAPHDLGTYPLANGQTYGGGEVSEDRQMPVEETGNLILLAAAIARTEDDASFAAHYWPLLTKWAEYLKQKGLDPENQLCTDDFAGHLAHNANLSLKAILALGAYGKLAEKTGHPSEAREYAKLARGFAARWTKMADDGNHYRLAFDAPGTWSQKYNLVWDRLLGLHLFPPEVARREIAYYKTKINRYGLPLDNRAAYTKLDWLVWTATLADSRADFEALFEPAYKFADETPTRVPLSDWYWTTDAKQRGFQARSVVGGIFIKMLAEKLER